MGRGGWVTLCEGVYVEVSQVVLTKATVMRASYHTDNPSRDLLSHRALPGPLQHLVLLYLFPACWQYRALGVWSGTWTGTCKFPLVWFGGDLRRAEMVRVG